MIHSICKNCNEPITLSKRKNGRWLDNSRPDIHRAVCIWGRDGDGSPHVPSEDGVVAKILMKYDKV